MSGVLEEWKMICTESVPWCIHKCFIQVFIFIHNMVLIKYIFAWPDLCAASSQSQLLHIKLSMKTYCTVDILVPTTGNIRFYSTHSDEPSEGTCNLPTRWTGIGCHDVWVTCGPTWVKASICQLLPIPDAAIRARCTMVCVAHDWGQQCVLSGWPELLSYHSPSECHCTQVNHLCLLPTLKCVLKDFNM